MNDAIVINDSLLMVLETRLVLRHDARRRVGDDVR